MKGISHRAGASPAVVILACSLFGSHLCSCTSRSTGDAGGDGATRTDAGPRCTRAAIGPSLQLLRSSKPGPGFYPWQLDIAPSREQLVVAWGPWLAELQLWLGDWTGKGTATRVGDAGQAGDPAIRRTDRTTQLLWRIQTSDTHHTAIRGAEIGPTGALRTPVRTVVAETGFIRGEIRGATTAGGRTLIAWTDSRHDSFCEQRSLCCCKPTVLGALLPAKGAAGKPIALSPLFPWTTPGMNLAVEPLAKPERFVVSWTQYFSSVIDTVHRFGIRVVQADPLEVTGSNTLDPVVWASTGTLRGENSIAAAIQLKVRGPWFWYRWDARGKKLKTPQRIGLLGTDTSDVSLCSGTSGGGYIAWTKPAGKIGVRPVYRIYAARLSASLEPIGKPLEVGRSVQVPAARLVCFDDRAAVGWIDLVQSVQQLRVRQLSCSSK